MSLWHAGSPANKTISIKRIRIICEYSNWINQQMEFKQNVFLTRCWGHVGAMSYTNNTNAVYHHLHSIFWELLCLNQWVIKRKYFHWQMFIKRMCVPISTASYLALSNQTKRTIQSFNQVNYFYKWFLHWNIFITFITNYIRRRATYFKYIQVVNDLLVSEGGGYVPVLLNNDWLSCLEEKDWLCTWFKRLVSFCQLV